jgi:hypothetical protein
MKILIGSVILIGVCLLAWLAVPKSKEIITITDFSAPVEASVRAPIRPFGTGAMYVMYEGSLDSDARIEVRSNHGRDAHTIELTSGSVQGVYGPRKFFSVKVTSDFAERGFVVVGFGSVRRV